MKAPGTRSRPRHGEYRAGWIVRETRPTNWDPSQGEPSPGADALVFPLPGDPPDPPVPRAEALPDCFAVVLIAGDNVVRTEYGRPVPDDLALGPDAAQADTWLQRDPVTGRLVAAGSLKWLIDFDAAELVGMALRIPLSAPFDTQGFDRLLVIGVRGAAATKDGPATLEALLAKHRYGGGCSIVRNGTPTNNTESARSGWQPASTEVRATVHDRGRTAFDHAAARPARHDRRLASAPPARRERGLHATAAECRVPPTSPRRWR